MSRARRVKCDEGKPSCTRCTSAARTCQGYQTPKATGSLPLNIRFYVPRPQDLSVDLVPFRGNEKERRAFAFFCERTAKCFQSEFSTFYLPQAANEEPAIRHAIIALGGIHEFCGLDEERLNGISPTDPFSERQYGKAISLLLNSTNMSSKHPTEVYLITCILFACFESLRGHIKSAITHVRCGLELLHQTTTADTLASFVYVPRKTIGSLFTHLDNQMMGLGGSLLLTVMRETERLSAPFSELKDPETFRKLEGAHESFDIFLNRALHVHRTSEMLLADPLGFSDSETLLLEIETERGKCLQYLDRWSRAFNQYLIGHGLQHERSSGYNIYVLQIWRVTAKIFLSVNNTDAQETWDQFQPEFNTIVTLAEALVETSTIANTSCQGIPSFSFHLGILPPLFLTSIRCRDPILRRRAVHILSSSRRCEGIWDSRLAATVAGHVINAEEKDVSQSAPGIETYHNHDFSAGNIRAYTRVREVQVAYDDGPPQIKLNWVG
ncbi:uncharacterized protein PAC_06009 [Phialocephala subalpina]|uniref:Zn(2)-C6 fungal-type domain-containing protein n=1 Tax=Phialocephala subalpina TaxID=576137 RepID=A0A1L7WTM7_9HELO|nr:uncharacterized protein PAC_06009 [Phialocephala subalpina]